MCQARRAFWNRAPTYWLVLESGQRPVAARFSRSRPNGEVFSRSPRFIEQPLQVKHFALGLTPNALAQFSPRRVEKEVRPSSLTARWRWRWAFNSPRPSPRAEERGHCRFHFVFRQGRHRLHGPCRPLPCPFCLPLRSLRLCGGGQISGSDRWITRRIPKT
jgi:hypothetical protein